MAQKFGYDNAAVGLWALAGALQVGVSLLLLCMGVMRYDEGSVIHSIRSNEVFNPSMLLNVSGNEWSICQVTGIAHCLAGLLVVVLCSLGIFINGCMSCPLTIFGFIEIIFCFATGGVTSYFLKAHLDRLPIFGRDIPNAVSTNETAAFAAMFASPLLLASAMLFTAGIVFLLAIRSNSDDTIPGSYLPTYAIAGATGAGIIFAVGGGATGTSFIYGLIWLAIVLANVVCTLLPGRCKQSRVFSLIAAIFYICSSAMGLIMLFCYGRSYYFVTSTPSPRAEDIIMYQIMSSGSWLLAGCCVGLFSSSMFLIAAASSFRSILSRSSVRQGVGRKG